MKSTYECIRRVKTSAIALVSPSTRSGAAEANDTKLPSWLIPPSSAPFHGTSTMLPAALTSTSVVVPAVRSRSTVCQVALLLYRLNVRYRPSALSDELAPSVPTSWDAPVVSGNSRSQDSQSCAANAPAVQAKEPWIAA